MMMMMMMVLLLFAATYGSVAGLPMKRSDARRFWITKVGPIHEELLAVQAVIVKDEEVPIGAVECKTGNADVRYSDKRYLMCAGSILTSRYILTSASCIHEATHIRHNVRAPLAAMIAPFSDTAQVIGIAEYNIHPAHQVDPREDDHALHNVAVLRLACRISKANLKEIQLPVQPVAEYCDDDSCFVTVIKKINPAFHAMYETQAKNVLDERDKREVAGTTDEIKETSDKDEAGKVLDTNRNKSASRVAEISEKSNNESAENNRKLNSKTVRSESISIGQASDRSSKNSVSGRNKPDKKLSVRASGGSKGCPQLGSAIMFGKIQTSIIATSCDDRQPETSWQYTDVYDNVDWINEMLGNWKRNNQTSVGGCQTCIYNFFIDHSCKDKGTCRKERPSGINRNHHHDDDVRIHGIELPNCRKNHTAAGEQQHGRRTFKNKSKPNNGSRSLNLAYLKAVNDMYSNKRSRNDVSGDDNQKLRTGLHRHTDANANERKEKNESRDARDMPTSKPMLWDDYLTSYREVKAVDIDNAERISWNLQPYSGRSNKEANKLKESERVSLEDFFSDGKYEESGIPDEYVTLYRKFLEMGRAKERANYN